MSTGPKNPGKGGTPTIEKVANRIAQKYKDQVGQQKVALNDGVMDDKLVVLSPDKDEGKG